MTTPRQTIVRIAQTMIDKEGSARLYFRSVVVDAVSVMEQGGVIEGTTKDGGHFYFLSEHLDGALDTRAPDREDG